LQTDHRMVKAMLAAPFPPVLYTWQKQSELCRFALSHLDPDPKDCCHYVTAPRRIWQDDAMKVTEPGGEYQNILRSRNSFRRRRPILFHRAGEA